MTVLPRVVFVTGTDTDVGKTIATAALAAGLKSRARTAAVYKPIQTGTYDGSGDVDIVRRLAGLDDVYEGIRLAEAMAPVTAAARAGVALPTARDHATTIDQLSATHDHVLVEGVGGLLVQLDEHGHTLADIAVAMAFPSAAVVVCRSGLGTLNHTELTIEALTRREIPIAGILVGSWPRHPTDIDLSNRQYLSSLSVPFIGAIPERAAALDAAQFIERAQHWITGIAHHCQDIG